MIIFVIIWVLFVWAGVPGVLKEDGAVLQETEYYAFGLSVSKSGNDAVKKYLYNGKEKQPETGFLDYGARMYDPAIGRWMVVDPLIDHLNQLTISPYAFSNNNPVNMIDDDGRLPLPIIGAVIGAVAKGRIELGGQLMAGENLNQVDTADAVGGKVFGEMGKSVTGSLESSAKKLTAEATTANQAASIAKSYAQETGKAGAKTYAGNLAKEATVATAKQKVVSTVAKVSKYPVEEVVKGAYQNKLTDAVKEIFSKF